MPPPPLPTILHDLNCVGCGYNLRTLPTNGICPECAKPVVESIPRLVTPWHDRRLTGLISLGAWLLIGSVAVFLIAIVVNRSGRYFVPGVGASDPVGPRAWIIPPSRMMSWGLSAYRAGMAIGLATVIISYTLRLAGIWLMTARPPLGAAAIPGELSGLRWAARLTATITTVLLTLTLFFLAVSNSAGDLRRSTLLLWIIAVELPAPILFWLYTSGVARRLGLGGMRVACLIAPWSAVASAVLIGIAFGFSSSVAGNTGVILNAAGAVYGIVILILVAVKSRSASRRALFPSPANPSPPPPLIQV